MEELIGILLTISLIAIFIVFTKMKYDEFYTKSYYIEEQKTEPETKKRKPITNYQYELKINNKSFEKGDIFERYTKNRIFKEKDYVLIHQTQNSHQNRQRYVESSLLPDFKFRNKRTNKTFWIECKFRSYTDNDFLEIISREQLERHSKLKERCFVFLGVGKQPHSPTHLFSIPIQECKTTMTWKELYKFKFN